MDFMTPEERFTKIENMLAITAEYLAKHAVWFEKHADWLDRHTEAVARHDAEIEKHNTAIRDLIVVSRTLLDSHQQTQVEIDRLRQSVQSLADTVDRIIRNQKPN